MLLIVLMIPGIFMVADVPFIIGSARWLAQHDQVERAHQQLSKLRHLPEDYRKGTFVSLVSLIPTHC